MQQRVYQVRIQAAKDLLRHELNAAQRVDDATDRWRKRLETLVNAKDSLFQHYVA